MFIFQCRDEKKQKKVACFYGHQLAMEIFVHFSFLKVVKFNLLMAPSIRKNKCLLTKLTLMKGRQDDNTGVAAAGKYCNR